MIQTKGTRVKGLAILICATVVLVAAYYDSVEDFLFYLPVVSSLVIVALQYYKTITIDAYGCTISLFCLHKSYPWSTLKTIRMLDFSKAAFTQGAFGNSYVYCEGVIFCTRQIKRYPKKLSPDMFGLICAPFRSFYIQFTPTAQYSEPFIPSRDRRKKERPCEFPVDRELFLSYIEKWGVKVEGLNAPLPPEELEQKKNKRR